MDDRELLMNAYRIYGAEGLRRLAKILNNKCMKELGLKYGDCMRSPIDIDKDYCIECTIRCIEEECLRRSVKSQLSSNMLIMVNIVDFNPNVKIETDRLKWKNHVSDLKYWSSEAAKLYGVSSIPFTVLIDKDGRVIGKNLRGKELENKLIEVFEAE